MVDMTTIWIMIAAGGCFVTIFSGIGIFMLVKHFRDKKKLEESQAWSATSGTVTQSYIREAESRDSDGYTTISYYPEVRYSYQVMGVEYTGDQVAFGGSVGDSNRSKAGETLMQYPVGKDMLVYFDPQNPHAAVLERRMGSKLFLIIGIIFTTIGVLTACIGGGIALFALM